jgi:glycogen debranching enzyme
LSDEKSFKTPNRVPALARSDKNYEEAGKYWRGGVWAPTNYMVLKGLDKYKNFELAHEIAMDYLRAVVDVFKKTDTLFENYAPEYIDGEFSEGNPAKSDFVGWTGLAPVSILFEYVFGIRPDAQNKKIVWYVNRLEKHGVKNYPLGDKLIDIICEKRNSVDETPVVTVTGADDITIEIVWNGKRITV